MSIRTISTEQLRRMGDREGLILQGCGGDPQEWLDGINQILTDDGILKKGTRFEEAYTFQHDGLTCLLFPFKENMKLDMGKLAVWRLASYSTFGGTWLSDYVPNRLGGFVPVQETKVVPEQVKPDLLIFSFLNGTASYSFVQINCNLPETTKQCHSSTNRNLYCIIFRLTAFFTCLRNIIFRQFLDNIVTYFDIPFYTEIEL